LVLNCEAGLGIQSDLKYLYSGFITRIVALFSVFVSLGAFEFGVRFDVTLSTKMVIEVIEEIIPFFPPALMRSGIVVTEQ
jgi:hypothetical protein